MRHEIGEVVGDPLFLKGLPIAGGKATSSQSYVSSSYSRTEVQVIILCALKLVHQEGSIRPGERVPPINPAVVIGDDIRSDDETAEENQKQQDHGTVSLDLRFCSCKRGKHCKHLVHTD